MKLFAAVVATGALGLGAFALTRPYLDVALGTIEMKGLSESKTLDANTIPSGGTSVTGTLVNKTGGPIGDVTVSVLRSGTTGDPPTEGGPIKVTNGGGGDSSEAEPGDATNGSGFTANVKFSGGVGSVSNNHAIDVEIPIGSGGTAEEIKIKITPSGVNESTGQHGDVLLMAELSEKSPGSLQLLSDPFHPATSMYVLNKEEDGGASITSLLGKFSLPSGSSLSSVSLLDPSQGGAAVPDAVVSLDGNKYTITGFTPLGPKQIYQVWVTYSAAPVGGYRIYIEAGLDQ